ncbi:hypothetical protein CEE37_05265 [candidate division LCP-89 bacterium B3_LCP]|uniref:Secretion system C-terminal sorting domain-containing protein n=1 Tax=candidate division LCP-89 bacterium B3_LCP TaxID=2012998 RepID=A0A532V253_UNCL8|nr:MAG: hypothetical protein CEE37_05265 [candidate division LCP-89 bacterium B3_LCP]
MNRTSLHSIAYTGLFILLFTGSVYAQDSLNVTSICQFTFDNYVTDLDLEGNLIALSAGTSGLLLYNVADPYSPMLMAQLDTFQFVSQVCISEDYLYLLKESMYSIYLDIIDIGNPGSPVWLSTYHVGDYGVNIDEYGGYVYISEANWGDLLIVDVTHPLAPCFGALFFVNGYAFGMDFQENYGFLVQRYGCTLISLDLTDPTNPVELCSIDLFGYGRDVSITGDYAYVSAGYVSPTLKVVDISDPSNLTMVGGCDVEGYTKGVFTMDDYLFVASYGSGLRVLNISDPIRPYEVGYYDTPGLSWDVAASGNFAFVADEDYFSIYDCSAAMSSDINITLTPLNPPVTIPATGGSFDFNIAISNNESYTNNFDAWIMVTLPDSSQYGPVLGPVNLTLPAGATIDRDRTQNVPGGAPPGTYTYEGFVGVYPDTIWDSNSFTFEKLETGDGVPIDDWLNTGEDFLSDELATEPLPSYFCLFPCHPNPFNPTTVISFSLPVAGLVTLEVFDISGKRVGVGLAPTRQYPPGTHNILFDGTGLSSGIYFASLTAGDFTQTQKLVLLK